MAGSVRRRVAGCALAMAAVLVAGCTQSTGSSADSTAPAVRPGGSAGSAGGSLADPALANEVKRAIVERDFAAVRDSGKGGAKLHQSPNIDTAVLELGADGRVRAAANVLVSPKYPSGVVVPLDENMATDQVRWRRWNPSEWDNGGKGTADAVAGRENAKLDFMSPYPASVLKLMVAYGVLRLVDQGKVTLAETYAYRPVGGSSFCGGSVSAPVRKFMDEMITVSSNQATCAMIKLIHDHNAMTALNQTFSGWGLDMLQLTKTDPANGEGWDRSRLVMSAADTAKLLLIFAGGPGTLWKDSDGKPVTSAALSASSRSFILKELGEQGLNQALSTTNWCGRKYPAPGIPQLTPKRWVNPDDGTVTVENRKYQQDVRPCDAKAEVTYAHKTGLVDVAGGDAGIVHALPGKPRRDYIVVMFSNLGERYVDADRPSGKPGAYAVHYSEKFGQLGAAIDAIMTKRRG